RMKFAIRMAAHSSALVHPRRQCASAIQASNWTSSANIVSVFDVEADRHTHSFQLDPLLSYHAHSGVVNYVCWDLNGEYMASVSKESVKVWSLGSGECIHELTSNGNQFHSCVFHPSYSTLLVGGNRVENEIVDM
ncbi:transcriptional corepressor LEUNIG_homolog isoform X1, partial [Tanacetum coccineum]